MEAEGRVVVGVICVSVVSLCLLSVVMSEM